MIRRVPFLSQQIDFEHILMVGDAKFIDRMGHGGYFIGFDIIMALRDKPVHFEFEADEMGGVKFESKEQGGRGFLLQRASGEWDVHNTREENEYVCVQQLQRWIDEQIVNPWKGIQE